MASPEPDPSHQDKAHADDADASNQSHMKAERSVCHARLVLDDQKSDICACQSHRNAMLTMLTNAGVAIGILAYGCCGAVDGGASHALGQVVRGRQGVGPAAAHARHKEAVHPQVVCQLAQVVCMPSLAVRMRAMFLANLHSGSPLSVA